jgi:hypothetical protein
MTPPNIHIDRAVIIAGQLVSGRTKHQDYTRVVELAATYKRLITGEDMGPLYKRYNRRESEADLKQALEITNPITPSICNALTNPLLKIANVPAKVNVIQYEGDDGGKKANALKEVLDAFNGGNDIDTLFGQVFLPEGIQDPNAFVLYTFENYDNRYEKPDVFATIQYSEDVWNFEYHSEVLQWLFLHKNIQYVTTPATSTSKAITTDGDKFILYTPEHHIVYTQIAKAQVTSYQENVLVDADNVTITTPEITTATNTINYFYSTGERLFEVNVYAQKSGRVPAFRLGFKRDLHTHGRTMVNLWHAAMPYLLKSVKSVRELDIAFVMHTFPIRLSYVTPCNAPDCNGGYTAVGVKCGVCKGENKQTVTSGQDGIEIALPNRPVPDLLIDLKKLMTYVDFPTDIVKLQMENVKDQVRGAFQAVYNSDIFVTDTTASTATEKKIDMQSVYDALQPASLWYSDTRMQSTYIIATYKDMDKGLIAIHRFPRDFHYESQDALLERINRAKGSVSNGLLTYWQEQLVDLVLVDDPYQAERVKTMTRFDPFLGKSDDAVVTIISQGLTTKRNKVLWSNLPYVFDRAEAMSMTDEFGGAVLYTMTPTKQGAIIDKIVAAMIEEMDAAAVNTSPRLELGADPEQEDATRDGEDTAEVTDTTDDGQGTSDAVPPTGSRA